MAKAIVNVEDVKPTSRNELTLYEFLITGGVRLHILGNDKADAIRRFRAMTEGDVVFIMADEIRQQEAA